MKAVRLFRQLTGAPNCGRFLFGNTPTHAIAKSKLAHEGHLWLVGIPLIISIMKSKECYSNRLLFTQTQIVSILKQAGIAHEVAAFAENMGLALHVIPRSEAPQRNLGQSNQLKKIHAGITMVHQAMRDLLEELQGRLTGSQRLAIYCRMSTSRVCCIRMRRVLGRSISASGLRGSKWDCYAH